MIHNPNTNTNRILHPSAAHPSQAGRIAQAPNVASTEIIPAGEAPAVRRGAAVLLVLARGRRARARIVPCRMSKIALQAGMPAELKIIERPRLLRDLLSMPKSQIRRPPGRKRRMLMSTERVTAAAAAVATAAV